MAGESGNSNNNHCPQMRYCSFPAVAAGGTPPQASNRRLSGAWSFADASGSGTWAMGSIQKQRVLFADAIPLCWFSFSCDMHR
jgi:hypothetical protein